MNTRRLYRCRQDRKIAGVAAGIAEYLEIDPTVVRVLWILSIFLGGFTILLYIILAFVMPLEPLVTPGAGPRPVPGGTTADAMASEAAAVAAEGPAAAEGSTAAGTTAGPAPAEGSAWTTHAHRTAVAPEWPADQGWGVRAHDPAPREGRPGRAGMVLGITLVAFGAIALAGTLVPGWVASAALGPAFLLALGVALLVASIRRPATDNGPATES